MILYFVKVTLQFLWNCYNAVSPKGTCIVNVYCNFPCKGAPILCKLLYINDQFALENKVTYFLIYLAISLVLAIFYVTNDVMQVRLPLMILLRFHAKMICNEGTYYH